MEEDDEKRGRGSFFFRATAEACKQDEDCCDEISSSFPFRRYEKYIADDDAPSIVRICLRSVLVNICTKFRPGPFFAFAHTSFRSFSALLNLLPASSSDIRRLSPT